MPDSHHEGSGFRPGRGADNGGARAGLVERCWEAVIVGVVLLPLVAGAYRPEAVLAEWSRCGRADLRQEDRLSLADGGLSRSDVEAMAVMDPQQQAEQLLEAAVVHDARAAGVVAAMSRRWTGALGVSPRLKALELAARRSPHLDVRAAEFDVELAAYNLAKTPETVSRLVAMAESDPPNRSWALIELGMLGNRGVQPGRVERVLLRYLNDPSEYVRAAAIAGLAYLGCERDVPLLLETFARDSSTRVRSQISQSLADSAMLTLEQRMKAVPGLLRCAQARNLDQQSRQQLYQALRGITRQKLPDNAAAWQQWWVAEGSMQARLLATGVDNS
jgi:hypothetical protein